MTGTDLTQYNTLGALAGLPGVSASQMALLGAFGPLATKGADVSQMLALAATSLGANNVSTDVSQMALLAAFGTGEPFTQRQAAWTFTLDGHKFYVLPLGPEGDWAYDITTGSWCQLKTDGFNGLNFTHGMMWGLRIMGGIFSTRIYMSWTPIKSLMRIGVLLHISSLVAFRFVVDTMLGWANFTLTASVNTLQSVGENVTLNFSDDNGDTWSPDFSITLTGSGMQKLIWNSLGSYTNPGRVFKITDQAGPMRIDGADVVLTGSPGADSGEEQEGSN